MFSAESPSARPPTRRFQFSLFTLFVVMTTAALASAIWVNWQLVGGVLLFILGLAAVLVLFAAIRVAIHWGIGGVHERGEP